MNFEVRNMKKEELSTVLALVKRVFDEFEAPDYSEEGIENFYKFACKENLEPKLNENFRIKVTVIENQIVGMIGYRDYSHVALLFVDKEFHKLGIAKNLFMEMMVDCMKNNENLEKITVNSSPYGLGFYKKMNFIQLGEQKEVDGIKFYEMEKRI